MALVGPEVSLSPAMFGGSQELLAALALKQTDDGCPCY